MLTLYPVNHLKETTPESTLGPHFDSFKSHQQLWRNLKFISCISFEHHCRFAQEARHIQRGGGRIHTHRLDVARSGRSGKVSSDQLHGQLGVHQGNKSKENRARTVPGSGVPETNRHCE